MNGRPIIPTLVALSSLAGAVHAQGDAPHVVIVTTGGTIASRTGAATLEGRRLVDAVPELADHATISVEEFARIGSSRMTPERWIALARRVNDILAARPDLAGVVVTHGTDTMEETAFFLNLTVRHARPVVMVGAMRSANAVSADGSANLLNAVRVAVAPEAAGKGVLLVMNDEINAARDVWKTDNLRVDAFRTPEIGLLGYADPDTVVFYRAPTRLHTAASEFDLGAVARLPHVPIVADFAGFDGFAIERWIEAGAEGLVLETFAGGRMSAGAERAVEAAVRAGTPVVVASRVPGGRIAGPPLVDGALLARDLPAHKARILLMLALAHGLRGDALQHAFDRY